MSKLSNAIGKLIGQPTIGYYDPKKHFLTPHHSNLITQGGVYRYSYRTWLRETSELLAAKHREINRPGRINEVYGSMGSRDLIFNRPRPESALFHSLKHLVP